MKSRNLLRLAFGLVVLGATAPGTRAEVPEIMVIQGTLEDSGGEPVIGPHEIRLEFFDTPAGGSILSSTSAIVDISSTGRFSFEMMAETAILEASQAWYELAVDTDGDGIDPGDVFPDRVPIRSVPFALLCADSVRLAGLGAESYSTDEERDEALAGKADLDHSHDEGYWSRAGNVLSITQEAYLGTVNDRTVVMIANGEPVLRLEPGSGSPNLLGGYSGNSAGPGVSGGAIGGGGRDLVLNQVTADFATVSGGAGNTAGGYAADIGGGEGNNADGSYATVGGGASNAAGTSYTTIGGGRNNQAVGDYGTVAGGLGNSATATWSTVGGGRENLACSTYTTVGGGQGNAVNASYGTISGGGPSDPFNPTTTLNRVHDDYGTIGGGGGNRAGLEDGDPASQAYATIGGGKDNTAGGMYALVGGGTGNAAEGYAATVAGGQGNVADNSYTTVGGGRSNTSGNRSATVGGGERNTAGRPYATVAGGFSNSADGSLAAVGGGATNSATGSYSTIPGGFQNQAGGASSFAAGNQARAEHDGSFVWSDATGTGFSSTAANQFLISASGGVGIGTNRPTEKLTVQGNQEIVAEGGLIPRGTYYDNTIYIQKPAAVSAFGAYAAVLSYATNILSIFDVSDPDDIRFIGGSTSDLHGPCDVQILGQRAYIASELNHRLVVMDISNATRPVSIGSIDRNLANPKAVYVSGKYAYVASSGEVKTGTNDGLAIFDISSPRDILSKDFISTNLDGTSDVYVSGRYAYVTSRDNNRLAVFDVSRPDAVDPRGYTSDFLISPVAVHVRGWYAYVLGEGSNNLVVFDVSDPNNLAYVGQISTSLTRPRSIYVSGDYATVAFEGEPFTAANCGLAVFDISDPANIGVVTLIDMSDVEPEAPKPVGVTGNGSHLFVIYEVQHALTVYDINHLDAPAITTGTLQAGHLDVTDNVAVENDLSVYGGLHVGSGGARIAGELAVAGRDNSYILGRLRVGSVGYIATDTVKTQTTYPTHKLDVEGEGRFRVNDYMSLILRSPNAGSDEDGFIDFVADSHIDVVTPSARIAFDKVSPVTDETTIRFYTKAESDAFMVERVVIDATGNLRPATDALRSLGDAAHRWTEVYTVNGVLQSSDVRLKENIAELPQGLEEVTRLRPVSFTWKRGSPEDIHYGLVAQEVGEILPEVVTRSDDPGGLLSMNYGELVPVLVKAVQEQQQQMEEQAAVIRGLQERLKALEGRP